MHYDAKTNGNNLYNLSNGNEDTETKTKQLILPVYDDANINKLVLIIKGMIQVLDNVENILIIIAGTIFGWVYKWGSLTMQINV